MSDSYFLVGIEALRYTSSPRLRSVRPSCDLSHLLYESKPQHKSGRLTEDDAETGVRAGDEFTLELYEQLHTEEMEKLQEASDRDVWDYSKQSTLPIAGEIVRSYVKAGVKTPWYIDLLNLNLNNLDLNKARDRIVMYLDTFAHDGRRITENLDFT